VYDPPLREHVAGSRRALGHDVPEHVANNATARPVKQRCTSESGRHSVPAVSSCRNGTFS
jgi:hypothetical protein